MTRMCKPFSSAVPGLAILSALTVFGVCSRVDAVPVPINCGNSEIRVAGTLAAKLIGCHATVARKGIPIDAGCLEAATDQFTKKFLSIESTGFCDVTGQEPDTRALIGGFVDNMVSILHPSNGLSRCAARDLAAVGERISDAPRAWVKYGSTGDTRRITKAALNGRAQLVAKFFRAEVSGDCVNNVEGETIATAIDQFDAQLIARLSPVVRLPAPTVVGMQGGTVANGNDGTSVYVPPLAFVPGQSAGFSVKAVAVNDALAQVAAAGLQLPPGATLIAAVQLGIGVNDPIPLAPVYVSLPEPPGIPSDALIDYDLAEPTSIAGFTDGRSPALHSMGEVERSGGQLTLRIPTERFGSPPGIGLVLSRPCFNECSYHGAICAQGGPCPVAGAIGFLAVNGIGGCREVDAPDGEYALEGCFADQVSPAQPGLIIHTNDSTPNVSVVLPACYAPTGSCAGVYYNVVIPLPSGTAGSFAGSWSGTFTSALSPGYGGYITFRLAQSGDTINGTGVIVDNSNLLSISGVISGTVSGSNSSVGVALAPGFSVGFTATLGGTGSMSGTYTSPADSGSWTATRR